MNKLKPLDVKLQRPLPGEWLYVYKEPGQTFDVYQYSKPVMTNDSQRIIYLQPLGILSGEQDSIIKHTAEYLHLFFDLEVKILNPISDSLIPADSKRIREDGHEQIHTKYVLDSLLEKNIPSDAIVVMAITNIDLYPQDSWNFVFGQAYTKKRIGISSLWRYYEDEKNDTLCLRRLIKTSSHEIGHMFSILHCTNAVCVMNGSNSLGESDSRPNRLCSECLKKLSWNLKFGIELRLTNLVKYFKKYHLNKEAALLEKDLAVLQNK